MLLTSLKLKNIRSYSDQTINFPPSTLLLSGDIGSGKSTLLLALEFALFGISKPDLTGETLLRKGTTQGSVELSFQLNHQNITIQRNLKKTKDAISQTAGALIINNLKKELTPLELKTEIINLLQYPEEFITKSKNYLFRYTLYCPQEEMKLILQEAPDSRLELLRKIFALDKYQKIRENLWFYLKEIRTKSLILKTKLEPLEPKKSSLQELRKKQEAFTSSFGQLLPQINKIKEEFQTQKTQLEALERQNQLSQQLKNQLTNLQALLQEKQSHQKSLTQKYSQLQEKISQLFIPSSKENIQQELLSLQNQQLEFLSQNSRLTAQLSYCQHQVSSLQKEISSLSEQTSSLEKKQQELALLEKHFTEEKKSRLKKEKEKIESSLDQLKQALHQNSLLFQQSQEIKEQVSRLDHCPTCLQAVPDSHKKQVLQTQQQKIDLAQNQIEELEQKKSLLLKQFLEINLQIESFLKKENLLAHLKAELTFFREKSLLLTEKKFQLQELVKENNILIEELKKLKPEDLNFLKHQISYQQELLQKTAQKQEWEKVLAETTQNLRETDSQIEKFLAETQSLHQKLELMPDLAHQLSQQKNILEELSEKEKSFLSEKAKLQAQQENIHQQVNLLIEEINQLNQLKTHLTRLTELHFWLEEFLIKLTYTIEKQIMVKIHALFNSLFQEWFSLLVEDENFSARLDDSFTPIIEQNGYEIYFSNLSGGERTAASLSYRLALNKVINNIIHEIKTKDLLILDEPTDGFSSEQLDKIRDILEKLNLRQIIIVSHESKIESFVDNIIRINKRGGVSQVI